MALGITVGASVAQQRPFASPVTFTGVNGSVNFPSGAEVIIGVAYYSAGGSQGGVSAMTIGGIAATKIVDTFDTTPGDNPQAALFYALMPAAETDTVVVTSANTFGSIGIGAIILTGAAASPTANSQLATTSGNPQQPGTSINLPAGGVGIAVLCATGPAIPTTPTWSTTGDSNITGAAGDLNTSQSGNSTTFLMAHSITTDAVWKPSVTGSPDYANSAHMAAVTWAAAAAAAAVSPQPPPVLFALPFAPV